MLSFTKTAIITIQPSTTIPRLSHGTVHEKQLPIGRVRFDDRCNHGTPDGFQLGPGLKSGCSGSQKGSDAIARLGSRKFLRCHEDGGDFSEDDMVMLYCSEFTKNDVRTTTAFYRTPVGQIAVSKLPILTTAGAQLGMQRVQANMGEHQQAIANRQAALQNPASATQ
ncbi:MAG: DUF2059 domain-containing protein [Rubripirellula sp.]